MSPLRRFSILVMLLPLVAASAPGCNEAEGKIVRQRAIADIACGPSAMFNWVAHGGEDLQTVYAAVAEGRSPEETVRQFIETYGTRRSATNPSVERYGPHNGGVGSVNLMLMARELLGDHLESPPRLRGEYLHREEDETTEEHLDRITGWFSESIRSGVPVILYMRGYKRSSGSRAPRNIFGHHVVITSLSVADDGARRIRFSFLDSATGRAERGELFVAERDFTAPTFTYRFEGNRVLTAEKVRTGRPLLEIRAPAYESGHPPEDEIIVAHFATFADDPSSP